jgi:type IV pilus assembly protein PilM
MRLLNLLNRLSRPDILIGIDKGRHSLKIVIARRTPAGLELEDFLIENLMPIEEAKRDSFCREKLFSLLQGKNISKAGVFFVIDDDKAVFAKRMTLPSVPAREIKQVLSWETKDTLPFPAAEAIFDFQIVEEKQNPAGQKSIDLIAMAVHRKAIDQAVAFLQPTGLSLENITIIPACLINIVNCLKNAEFQAPEPIAFLEVGHRHSTLCIFKEKKLIFVRQLLIGSGDITNSMMTEVSTNAGRIDLSYEEAEKIKLVIGLPQKDETVKVGNQILESSRLSSMIRPTLEKITQEIEKSFIYAREKLQMQKPKTMYLIGGGSLLKNIDKFFKDQLKIDVKVFSPDKEESFCAKLAPEKEKEISQIVPVVGAVVGQESQINLLPLEFKKKKIEAAGKILLRIIIFAAFAILGLNYVLISFQQINYKAKYNIMKRQQDVRYNLRNSKNEIEKTQAAISAIKGNRLQAITILEELSLRTPRDILLDSINYSYSDEDVKISGAVLSAELTAPVILSEYIKIIENSPIFQSVNLVSSAQRPKAETSVLEFTISYKLEASP